MNNDKKYNRFIAIDFETANYQRNSACALGIALVEDLVITDQFYTLIKPPQQYFMFTGIHGITREDVRDKPAFNELWPDIKEYFNNIDFIAAHNVAFDRSVLEVCCNYYGIQKPSVKYECTFQMSRKRLNLDRYSLDKVSEYFGIELQHHNALSDTLACAEIMIRFLKFRDDCDGLK